MYDYRCYIDLQCPYRSRKELSEKISARNEMHFRGPETFDEFRIEINRKPMSLCRKFTASKQQLNCLSCCFFNPVVPVTVRLSESECLAVADTNQVPARTEDPGIRNRHLCRNGFKSNGSGGK